MVSSKKKGFHLESAFNYFYYVSKSMVPSIKKKVFTWNQPSIIPVLDMKFNLNKDILSHNKVPLEKPKCTSRGTCIPVWEPLL